MSLVKCKHILLLDRLNGSWPTADYLRIQVRVLFSFLSHFLPASCLAGCSSQCNYLMKKLNCIHKRSLSLFFFFFLLFTHAHPLCVSQCSPAKISSQQVEETRRQTKIWQTV